MMSNDETINKSMNVLELTPVGVYSVLTVVTSIYAFLLNSKRGRVFAAEHTWASVVLGTTLVLGCVRVILPDVYWRRVALAFVFAGMPMIGRSVYSKTSK